MSQLYIHSYFSVAEQTNIRLTVDNKHCIHEVRRETYLVVTPWNLHEKVL